MRPACLALLAFAVTVLGGSLHAAAPEAPAVAQAPPEAGPALVHIRDQADGVEFDLPAPYWKCLDRQALAAQSAGGCQGGGRLPPGLMFMLEDKDALARAQGERNARTFLMRDKKDLEAYVNAYVQAVAKLARSQVEETKPPYQDRGGMIVHEIQFTTTPQSGGTGGCSPQPGAALSTMRYMVVEYFVRRKDADAVEFRLFFMAPADVFDRLKPEFDHIRDSFRLTGPVAEQFFVPDAPANKVLTPKDAARSAGGGSSGNYVLPIVIGVFIIAWFILRRRKPAAAS